MAKIPAGVWLAVGIAVVLTAWYADMALFFWLGWAFAAFGIAKLVAGYMLGVKETHLEKKIVQQAMPRAAHQYYRCSCGNPVKATDNFCSYCGRRLR